MLTKLPRFYGDKLINVKISRLEGYWPSIELSSASQARKEIQNLNEKCFQLKNAKKSK